MPDGGEQARPPAPPEPDPAAIVTCLADLMRLFGAADRAALDREMNDRTEEEAWVDWEWCEDSVFVVCVSDRGTGLEYPFTLQVMWDTLRDLNAEIMGEFGND